MRKMPQIDSSLAKKAIKLAFFLALFMILYMVMLKYGLVWMYPLFYIAEGILFCVVFVLTRCFSKKPPSASDYPPDMPKDELSAKLSAAERRHALGKELIYALLPLSLVIIFDIVWVNFFLK